MSKFLLVASIVCPSLLAAQPQDWKQYNSSLEAGYVFTMTFDLLASRYGMQHKLSHEENPLAKPFLDHASDLEWAAYLVINMIWHPLVSMLLPEPYRTIFQSLTVSIHLYENFRNAHLGLKLSL